MPETGGVLTRNYSWVTDEASAIDIDATRMDADTDDLVTSINNRFNRDGSRAPSADLPMATFKFTGVGDATARNHFSSAGQVQDGEFTYKLATGSANAYVITLVPAITAYAIGQKFTFKANFSITGASTLQVNALAAKALVNSGGVATVADDIQTGDLVDVIYDGTNFVITANSARQFGKSFTSPIKTTDTTASTSTTTGSGIFAGGLGVAGAIYVGGNISITGSGIAAFKTSTSNVASRVGMVCENSGDANNAWRSGREGNGSYAVIHSTGATDGVGTVTNVMDLDPSSYQATFAGVIKTTDTTASTSPTTGSGIFAGGVGVAGALYVGGLIQANSYIKVDAGLSAVPALYLYADAGNTNALRVRYTGNQQFAIRDDTASVDRLTIDPSGNAIFSGPIKTTNAAASTSTTTGSGIFAGGLGVAGDIIGGGLVKSASGTTGSRPAPQGAGSMWFDTTLGLPIWHDGTNWITGAASTIGITDSATSSQLTITDTTSTFINGVIIGDGTVGGLLTIKTAALGSPYIYFNQDTNEKASIGYLEAGASLVYQSDGGHIFRSGGLTIAMTIDNTQGVTVTKQIATGGGATGSRPTSPLANGMWFDTTLGKPIWYDGTNWVDATGATM